jgi:hypothetical protein
VSLAPKPIAFIAGSFAALAVGAMSLSVMRYGTRVSHV